MLELGDATIQTYLAVRRNRNALALDAIVGIRARTSTALRVAPRFWVDDSPVSYGAGVNAGPAFDQFQGWRRWLEFARAGGARPLFTIETRS